MAKLGLSNGVSFKDIVGELFSLASEIEFDRDKMGEPSDPRSNFTDDAVR
jgi:hypothetical protein